MLNQNQFDTEFQKTCLVGCNVLIYTSGFFPSIIIDKKNIRSFTLKRGNNGVLDTIPYDEATLEIIGWKSLTSTKQNSLKSGQLINVRFGVNGYDTSNGIYLYIEDLKIDSANDDYATIKCVGLFKHPYNLRRVDVLQRLSNITGSPQTYPMDVTRTEKDQYVSLSNGQGIKTTGVSIGTVDTTTIDLNTNTSVMNYLKKNIIGNVKKYEDTPDKSQIETVGVDTDVDIVALIDREVNYGGQHYSYFLPYEQQSLLIDYQGKALINGTWQDLSKSTNLGGFKCVGGFEFNTGNYSFPTAPTKLRFIALGKKVRTIADNNSQKSIMCRTILDTETTKLTTTQTKIRGYYSHTTYYEFDCRIDPRIEPQDCITVEGIGVIRVEETRLTFSGGFKGHIKGRLVQAI